MEAIDYLRMIIFESMKMAPDPHEGAEWKWPEGATILVDPPMRCPYCEQYFQSNRLWVISKHQPGVKPTILGVWDIRTGERIPIASCHPHVFQSSGRICMGRNKSVIDALCHGFNPGDQASQILKQFFRAMGDECEEISREWCRNCYEYHDVKDMVMTGFREEQEQWQCSKCYKPKGSKST